MSVRTMARVWEHSSHGGTELLMLLALADFSDDEGNCYPAVDTLATKCRMKSRNANYILTALQASGELEVRANKGPGGVNRYRIVFGAMQGVRPVAGVQSLAGVQRSARTPATHCRPPLHPIADEPSLNHQEPKERGSLSALPFRPSRSRALPKAKATNDQGSTLAEWRAELKLTDQKFLPPRDSIFEYADNVGLDPAMLDAQWDYFKIVFTEERPGKRYLDWRATYRASIRKNWFKFWRINRADRPAEWTSDGLQAIADLQARSSAQGQQ